MAADVPVPVLVFDGDCAFCTSSVRWMRRWISDDIAAVPWQEVDLESLGLSAEMCQKAVQWVGPGGTVAAGHLAIAAAMVHVGGAWRGVGRALTWPGVSSVAGWVYAWVARNRGRLPGGTPACALPVDRRARVERDSGG